MTLSDILGHLITHGIGQQKLSKILEQLQTSVDLRGIQQDSRKIAKGDLFLACSGFSVDGREKIDEAIASGAVAVLQEASSDVFQLEYRESVPVIAIPNLKRYLSYLASEYYGKPTKGMTVIGITGTNGKTSCLHFLAQALTLMGKRVATIGTLGSGIFPTIEQGALTTPDAITVHQLAHDFLNEGVECLVMEVSSHSLDQGRVSGVAFDMAVFTNLSRDHLDYHKTLDEYACAKRKLFDFPGLKYAVINCDDQVGRTFIGKLNPECVAYGFQQNAPEESVYSEYTVLSSRSGLTVQWKDPALTLSTSILGDFNGENLAAVSMALIVMEYTPQELVKVFASLQPVPGRMQLVRLRDDQPLCIVDYAHTPDALEKLLQAASVYLEDDGKLICVFGCGGDRDKGKRAQMSAKAACYADKLVITSDNPRTEDPQAIIADIQRGVPKEVDSQICLDRSRAIQEAIVNARHNDVVVIAGKGHEKYQLTKEGTRYFSDEEEAMRTIK
jgi:UDP-N-acetylmuramoyl-L-alanyl-D-glutamate--2,6-diaminopimelate ligase